MAAQDGNGASIVGRWNALSSRERLLIGVMGALVIIIGCVYLLLLPGLDAARSSQDRRERAQASVQAVRGLAHEVSALRERGASATNEQLKDSAVALAESYGIRANHAEATGADIVLDLSAPSANALLEWSNRVAAELPVVIDSFSAKTGAQSLEARVRLVRFIP